MKKQILKNFKFLSYKTNALLNIEIVSIEIILQKQVRDIFPVWANVLIKTDVLEWHNIYFMEEKFQGSNPEIYKIMIKKRFISQVCH